MSPLMFYSVDCALHRYESSLKNIVSISPSALKFSKMAERVLILEAWYDHLFSEESFVGTAVAYCSTSSLEKKCSAGISFRWLMKRRVNNGWNG